MQRVLAVSLVDKREIAAISFTIGARLFEESRVLWGLSSSFSSSPFRIQKERTRTTKATRCDRSWYALCATTFETERYRPPGSFHKAISRRHVSTISLPDDLLPRVRRNLGCCYMCFVPIVRCSFFVSFFASFDNDPRSTDYRKLGYSSGFSFL